MQTKNAFLDFIESAFGDVMGDDDRHRSIMVATGGYQIVCLESEIGVWWKVKLFLPSCLKQNPTQTCPVAFNNSNQLSKRGLAVLHRTWIVAEQRKPPEHSEGCGKL